MTKEQHEEWGNMWSEINNRLTVKHKKVMDEHEREQQETENAYKEMLARKQMER